MRNYSLGMRQRLGIANALMGDPSVLILDEPVNGLDPAGIHWMRGLLRNFAGKGGTVLLSSHLLHEVEMIADEMVLIGRGKIVAQGTKAELLHTAGTYVKPEDPAALEQALQAAGIAATPSGDGGFRSRGRSRSRSVGPRRPPASCWSSSSAPRAPGSRRCSCSSPPTTPATSVTAEGVTA